ncbi:MAG: hemin uptake protein HemP [Tardiphaga sp.]|jgi:hemin uptake protein HemP
MTTLSRDGIKNGTAAAAGSDAERGRERTIIVNGDRLESKDLFADQRELFISHGGDTYRLRLTFQNKLILTK